MQFDSHTEKYPRKKRNRTQREDRTNQINDSTTNRSIENKDNYAFQDSGHIQSGNEEIENAHTNSSVNKHDRRRYKYEYARRFHSMGQGTEQYRGDKDGFTNQQDQLPEESIISGSVQYEKSDLGSRDSNNINHLHRNRETGSKNTPYSASFSGYDDDPQSVKNINQQEAFGGSEAGFWNPEENDPLRDSYINQNSSEAPVHKRLFQKVLSSFGIRKLTHQQDNQHTRSTSQPNITAKVVMLDGEELVYQLSLDDTGQTLFDMVCRQLDLYETDYFGLTCVSNKIRTWFWLDLQMKISKQLKDGEQWFFYFQVKFYPPEPSMLQEDLTRYQLALQIRQDIYTGKLPCSWVTQALLGSFMVQSELGDYDPQIHTGLQYLKEFEFVQTPTPQLLQKIMELHKTHVSMKPNQADIKYLETAKRLELYGVDLHPARDTENVEIYIGVGFHGVVIYRDRLRIGRFAWPKVLRISYKKNNFFLKIRPDYSEPVEAIVGFRLMNPFLANRLWKTAVEHHGFFRLKDTTMKRRTVTTPSLNKSNYRFTGRTFFQYRTVNIDRPNPQFNRSLVKRQTCSLPSGLNATNTIHSFNRTHPRDMSVGRTTQEQLPLRLTGSMNIPGPNGEYSNPFYGTIQNNGSAQTNARTKQRANIPIDDDFSYGRRGSEGYSNVPPPADEHNDLRVRRSGGSVLAGSMVSGYSSQRQSQQRGSHQLDNVQSPGSDLSHSSPMYVNTKSYSTKVYNDDESPNQRERPTYHSQSRKNSSSGNRPPPGGVPALSGIMLQNPHDKRMEKHKPHRQKTEDPIAKSRHRYHNRQNEANSQEVSVHELSDHEEYGTNAKYKYKGTSKQSRNSHKQLSGSDELL